MLYEGGVRVPLIVRWTGVIPAGRTSDEPVATIDFYPTFVELAGGKKNVNHALDGLSLVALWRSGGEAKLARDALFWHFPGYLEADETGTWRTTPAGSIRSGDWSLIEFFEDHRIELYDLSTDLGQQRDLSAVEPGTARRLHDRLRAWRAAINAPMPAPNPRFHGK
jgi:arylsulfatase A-like enzyme